MITNDVKVISSKLIAMMIVITSFCFATLLKATESMQDPTPRQLSLEMAVNSAIKFDPWLRGNQYQQDSIESLSVAAGTMADPKVSIGLANIASDSFDFNQEAMTQFKEIGRAHV